MLKMPEVKGKKITSFTEDDVDTNTISYKYVIILAFKTIND